MNIKTNTVNIYINGKENQSNVTLDNLCIRKGLEVSELRVTAKADGVYVLTEDKRLVRRYGPGVSAKPIGVVAIDRGESLLVALTGSKGGIELLGNSDQLVTGKEYPDRESAYRDFDGKGNTAALLRAGSKAAKFCNEYTCGYLKKGSWWMPSFGEMDLMYRNKIEIDNRLKDCGGEELPNEWHWTSSEFSRSSGWVLNWYNGSTCNHFRNYAMRVRPVSAFSLSSL